MGEIKTKRSTKFSGFSRIRHFRKRKLTPIVSLVKNGQELFIGPTDGTKTIIKATDLFKAGIEECFGFCELSKPGEATEETFVEIYRVNQVESLLRTFKTINSNFGELSLGQGQIIDFCLNYPNLFLIKGVGTLFLTKKVCGCAAVLVFIKPNGLEVTSYNPYSDKNLICEWISCKNLRIIVPRLTIQEQYGSILLEK